MELKDLYPGMKILNVYADEIVLKTRESVKINVSDSIVTETEKGYVITSPEFEVCILGDCIFSVVEKAKALSFNKLAIGMILHYPCEESDYVIQSLNNEYIPYKKPKQFSLTEPEAYNIIIVADGMQIFCSYEGNGNLKVKNFIGTSEEEKSLQLFASCFYQFALNRDLSVSLREELLRSLISRSECLIPVEKTPITKEFVADLMNDFVENVKTGKKISAEKISNLYF